jgi:flavin reductase (DIM6/NTAB) family NADH-FMN oxidoreductase RutF
VRTDFDPDAMRGHEFYRLLTAVVVPRPIAWVSTTSAQDVDNLAPHSFFTVACVTPPIVQFTSMGRKDSLRNVEEAGEFVINLAGEPMFEQINASATNYPRDIDEFDALDLVKEPSKLVRPPRVAESPVAIECRLHSTMLLGDATVVFGRVVHVSVDERVLVDGYPEIDRLRPLARLGRNEWSTIGEVRQIDRIGYRD